MARDAPQRVLCGSACRREHTRITKGLHQSRQDFREYGPALLKIPGALPTDRYLHIQCGFSIKGFDGFFNPLQDDSKNPSDMLLGLIEL